MQAQAAAQAADLERQTLAGAEKEAETSAKNEHGAYKLSVRVRVGGCICVCVLVLVCACVGTRARTRAYARERGARPGASERLHECACAQVQARERIRERCARSAGRISVSAPIPISIHRIPSEPRRTKPC